MAAPDFLKDALVDIDQRLEVVEGKLKALAGEAGLRRLPPDITVAIKRRSAAIGHTRQNLRDIPSMLTRETGRERMGRAANTQPAQKEKT